MGASRPFLPRIVGRYALYGEIAAGGMATVHYGRLLGPVGFSRTVAIKRLHPQFAKDPEFVSMFLDEARLAGRIRHPNVVQTLDVVALEGELFLVMDYVQGESLGRLIRLVRASPKKEVIPLQVVSAILVAALQGLHAAHEAKNERGEPLNIVHRDVSPQNILVGADGAVRVLDFGVAKARGRMHTTREGQVKGKLAYMAPETLLGHGIDRRADIYAAGVVLWETLTRQRLFSGDSEGAIVGNVLNRRVDPPSAIAGEVPEALDAVTMRALDRAPSNRFASAREMAVALERCVPPTSAMGLTEWVEGLAGEVLAQRAKALAQIENDSGSGHLPAHAIVPESEQPVSAPSGAKADAGLSQVSSVTMSTSALRRQIIPSKPRRWWALAALPVAAVLLAGLAFAAMHRTARPEPAASRVPADTPQPASDALPAPFPTNAPIPPPPSAEPAAPSPATAAPTAPRAATHVVSPARPPPAATPAAASAKPCAIKSYVDGSGITHFVEECS